MCEVNSLDFRIVNLRSKAVQNITQFENTVPTRETLDGPRKRRRMDTAPGDIWPTVTNMSKLPSPESGDFRGEGRGDGDLCEKKLIKADNSIEYRLPAKAVVRRLE